MNNPQPLIGSEKAAHYAMWPWGLSFQLVKTTAAKVVWSNSHLPFEGGEKALLEEFAWHIPNDSEQIVQGQSTKTFYAECYGGNGIHHNGGGARCAWNGNWLVKGIGVNLMSGYTDEEAAEHRKNGRASLCEILVETIWGEVLHYALPYGSVRMTAVIKTGETLTGSAYPTGGTGIREFVWRPAHFMRAPGFHIRPENRALIPSDTERVTETIARLPGMLPMPASLSESNIADLEPLERLKIGLEEMMRRFAEQMATGKAKRLSHGTLTPSNVSLDGRWNDLNSVSALPSYGYRRNMTPFWDDHTSFFKTIDLLCFYIGKYFPAGDGNRSKAMPTGSWLSVLYMRHYEGALARRFVALCGYPQIVADRVWSTPAGEIAMRRLAAQIIFFARSGHSPRRPYDDDMHVNTVFGDYNLPKILKSMVGSGFAESNVEDLIIDPKIRQVFVLQYRVVKKMMFAAAYSQGVSAQAFTRIVAINCIKAGRNIPFLFRNVIFQKCGLLAEEHQELSALRHHAQLVIQPVIDEARMLYQEPRDFTTLLLCTGTTTLAYDAKANCLTAEIAGKKSTLPCMPMSVRDTPCADATALFSSMRTYWGITYEEIMR